MGGIWGVKEFRQNCSVSKEMLEAVPKRARIKEGYRHTVFPLENIGLGCWSQGDINCDAFSFHDKDKSICVILTGTIHNLSELRADLEKKGNKFYTGMDAEVIARLYEEAGENFASKLYGGFVIALWDKHKNSLILCRDPLGIKPLYYTVLNNKIIFSSQLKLIIAHPDVQAKLDVFALSEYFSFEYIPGPKTIFSQINKLLPAQVLICRDEKVELKKYWQLSYKDNNLSQEQICTQIITKLKESIKYSLKGNSLKGVLLSGGIDSSAIVALMRESGYSDINTFSAVFEDKAFDESSNSFLVARHFNTKHHQILVNPKNALGCLDDIFFHLDEPLADASVMPTYLVASLAQKQGMKVCLTGDGGDELFGGYDMYSLLRFLKYFSDSPAPVKNTFNKIIDLLPVYNYRGLNFKIKKFKEGINLPPELAYYAWWGAYSSKEQKRLFTAQLNNTLGLYDPFRVVHQYLRECGGLELLNRVFYMDLKFNLCDGSLRKSEMMASLNFLEARPAFLYSPLVELSSSIPHYLKLKGLTKKYIFKKAISPYLPAKIVNVPKRGFDIPLEDWMRKDLKNFVIDSLSEGIIKKQGFLNYAYIQKLLEEHFSGKANHRQKIWPVIVFTRWYEAIFD